MILLRLLYADPGPPCLERKRMIWNKYALNGIGAGGGS